MDRVSVVYKVYPKFLSFVQSLKLTEVLRDKDCIIGWNQLQKQDGCEEERQLSLCQ